VTGWAYIPFKDACSDVSGGNRKVAKADYAPAGAFPVVDQGQTTIAGYTDDSANLFRGNVPVIIFGDHTRRFKFVDFPFAIGADGVKVLAAQDCLDPRYLFHYFKSLNIPAAGYSRHFKFLSNYEVPVPSLKVQRRIAGVLDAADALRIKQHRATKVAASLVTAAFHNMFGSRYNEQASCALGDLVDTSRPITYGILKPGPDRPNGVPYVRVVDIVDGLIRSGEVRRTTHEISAEYRRSTLRTGDLVMSIRGRVGRLGQVPRELEGANITQDSARLAVTSGEPRFVMEAIRSPEIQRWMARRTKGAAVQGINLSDVRRIPIPLAPIVEQRAFAALATGCDLVVSRLQRTLAYLDALFASLQDRAFRGEL
jgi:type I restriction enzyme S subunit